MKSSLIETAHAKALFEDAGISMAEWARVRGFSTGLVYQVLEGNRKCLRGQSHRIAIALGLKRGSAIDINELSKQLEERAQLLEPQLKGVTK